MTNPPGGPYGQDPSGANPYWQHPYWGGQPPSGQPPGGQPPGEQPQGGPYQGGPYQNPPPGQYQYPQGDPYAAGGYPPPQYQPGQQLPPPWPGGPYPPGPPPGGSRSKTPWLIGGGIAVVVVIALVVTLIFVLGNRHHKSTQAQPSATTAPSTSQPNNSPQNATDCTPNVSAVPAPTGDAISAGPLSFPGSAAPGWAPFSDNSTPNAIDAVGVAQEVPGANQWIMQAEVMMTNFVPSMDVATQASTLLNCMVNGPGYAQSSPTLGPTKTSTLTVGGTDAARVDADITIGDTSRNVPGDSVTIIAVKTKPVTVFFAASPIGDAGDRAPIDAVIAALTVSNS